MAWALRNETEAITMASVTTAAGAVNTTTTAVRLPKSIPAIVFVLDVTAAATDAGDTLDVTVQTLIDGVNWVDVVAFTQVLGNGGAKRYVAKVTQTAAETLFLDAALAAGNVRQLIGDSWKVKYVQADANSNGSFTFKVYACPQ